MKNKIITFLFLGYIFFFSFLGIILKDKKISNTERRKLTTYPNFELNSQYITEVDKYFLDHFPFREEFRSLKANYNYKILNKLDNNKIYLKNNYIFKSNYPTNKNSIQYFFNNINKIKNMTTKKNNIYMMIIPDKNYYLKDKNFLQIDYQYIYNLAQKEDNFIDIRDILYIDDYYETDTHWKQERIDKVTLKMSSVMKFDYQKITYKKNYFKNFYGVYYGEAAIKRKPETLVYLTNDLLDSVSVKYLENDKLNKIYNIDKLNSMDAYSVYLDGASSFIEITNDKVSNKELIVFRDSFGSSLIPLLVPYYSKITIIDNRYISSDYFKDLIEFKDQDVLFLYSTLLVNESGSLKN